MRNCTISNEWESRPHNHVYRAVKALVEAEDLPDMMPWPEGTTFGPPALLLALTNEHEVDVTLPDGTVVPVSTRCPEDVPKGLKLFYSARLALDGTVELSTLVWGIPRDVVSSWESKRVIGVLDKPLTYFWEQGDGEYGDYIWFVDDLRDWLQGRLDALNAAHPSVP